MTMLATRRIVVGMDGSPAAAEALKWAVAEARLGDAVIEVVYAWDPSPIVATGLPPLDWSQLRDAAEEHARVIVRRAVGEDPGVEITTTVAVGRPQEALVEASAEADLLVVGSRGGGGLAGIAIGSVGHHCAEHAECPVLVVHHNPLRRRPAREARPRMRASAAREVEPV